MLQLHRISTQLEGRISTMLAWLTVSGFQRFGGRRNNQKPIVVRVSAI